MVEIPFEPFDDDEEMFHVDEPEYCLPVTYEDFLYELEDNIFGQDDELEDIAYDIYTYLQGSLQGNLTKHNFILAGPSASGKTELYRTVKRILKKYACPIPVIHIDISGFSPTGFQGEELNVIPEMILEEGSHGPAIVFLDEFDKILTPLHGSNHDNINKVLQSELLTLIEGRNCTVKQRNLSHTINTSETLFVAMGAFTEYRKEKTEKPKTTPIGFTSTIMEENKSTEVISSSMNEDDLQKVGGMIELLGRFDNLYNFHPIQEEHFDNLFQHIVNNLAIEQKVLIKATKTAMKEFFPLIRTDYGCREVKRTLYKTIKPCLKKIADEQNRIQYYIAVYGVKKAELKLRK